MSTTAIQEIEQPELEQWLDPEHRYEIVDGREVEVPPMSPFAEEVASTLFFKIGVFAETNDLGKAQHEILFRLALPKSRSRIPDVAFTSYERWPKGRPFPLRGNGRDVVPDLAVEVISPGDSIYEISIKLDEYFRAGVRLVWVVNTLLKQVHVYRSIASLRLLTEADELDGEDVLPGFRIPVASLFPLGTDEE